MPASAGANARTHGGSICAWISFRFNLTKRAGLPLRQPLGRAEAERWRDHYRDLARKGKITRRGRPITTPTREADGRTMRQVCDGFLAHWENDPSRRRHRLPALAKHLAAICRTDVNGAPFGDRVFADLRTPDIEGFRDARRRVLRQREAERAERTRRLAAGDLTAQALPVSPEVPHARQGEVGINRTLERLRALFNWAIERGHYHSENPFLKHGRPAIRMAKEVPRTRRLQGDEEQRLLKQASADMHDLIIAALDTGMRRRELLSLTWLQVRLDAAHQPTAIMVSAEMAKTNRPRTVPVLSARLRMVLLRRRLGPNGQPLPVHAYVFGNEVGEPVKNVKRAWRGACRRAKITGLNFHDLRREAGSRWLEGGVGLLTVSALLGHAQVTTTNTYLASSPVVAEDELRAFEQERGNLGLGAA